MLGATQAANATKTHLCSIAATRDDIPVRCAYLSHGRSYAIRSYTALEYDEM